VLVAIATTNIPILVKSDFWAKAHEVRIEYTILLGSAFLPLVGAGRLPT
jgi:putative oxidoreductase